MSKDQNETHLENSKKDYKRGWRERIRESNREGEYDKNICLYGNITMNNEPHPLL
jgi:hypothetical protein